MPQLLPATDYTVFATDFQAARQTLLTRYRALPDLSLNEHIHHRHPEPGPDGKPLHADWLLLSRSPQPQRLLVLISGTHGVEGFVGSAIQCDLLGNGIGDLLQEDESLAILLIHALNPWGFAWLRRCDHEGIDLNRNFVDFKAGLPNNGAYSALHRRLAEGVDIGKSGLSLDTVSRGQYQYPNGLYFGGHGPSWSRQWLESRKHSVLFNQVERMAVIDLHSGLGPFGYGELINDHPKDSAGFEQARRWYGANALSSVLGESVSAPKTGLIDYFWHKLMGERGCFVTLEFGTYSSEAMMQALIAEQRYVRRCREGAEERDLTHPDVVALRDFFYPADKSWRQAVLLRARQVVELAIAGLSRS